MTIPSNAAKIAAINGIPLYYERRTSEDEWGDLAENEKAQFYVSPTIGAKLGDCFEDLSKIHPWGRPKGIISAGMYVDKPGEHGKAAAFDLDGIIWPQGKWNALAGSGPIEEYLGIQAHMMLYFGVTLGYQYNPAHRDHLHCDMSHEVGFIPSEASKVLFIQDALNTLWLSESSLELDGAWGPKTADCMRAVIPFDAKYPNHTTYARFLNTVRDESFHYWATKKVPEQKPSLEERVRILEERMTKQLEFNQKQLEVNQKLILK